MTSLSYWLTHDGSRIDILRDVDLTVSPGETVGLTGPSGSGKSTLLALVAGMERPGAGRVQVNGHALETLDPDALARFRRATLGCVFQAFHLVPAMTALENVALPLELAGQRDAHSQAAAQLTDVGLGHRLHHRPRELSGGEQQRVAIARAFVARPPLLLADELTGNLDPRTSAHVVDQLFDLVTRHRTTLLLVTHDPALARRTHRRLVLEEGRLRELS